MSIRRPRKRHSAAHVIVWLALAVLIHLTLNHVHSMPMPIEHASDHHEIHPAESATSCPVPALTTPRSDPPMLAIDLPPWSATLVSHLIPTSSVTPVEVPSRPDGPDRQARLQVFRL